MTLNTETWKISQGNLPWQRACKCHVNQCMNLSSLCGGKEFVTNSELKVVMEKERDACFASQGVAAVIQIKPFLQPCSSGAYQGTEWFLIQCRSSWTFWFMVKNSPHVLQTYQSVSLPLVSYWGGLELNPNEDWTDPESRGMHTTMTYKLYSFRRENGSVCRKKLVYNHSFLPDWASHFAFSVLPEDMGK